MVSVEVFIRHLLYYSLRHLKQLIACLQFSEENAQLLSDHVGVGEASEA